MVEEVVRVSWDDSMRWLEDVVERVSRGETVVVGTDDGDLFITMRDGEIVIIDSDAEADK